MTYPPEPFGVIEISGALGGSLLVPVTWNDPAASSDNASAAVTVATCTILPFGGHTEQPGAGMPWSKTTSIRASVAKTGWNGLARPRFPDDRQPSSLTVWTLPSEAICRGPAATGRRGCHYQPRTRHRAPRL